MVFNEMTHLSLSFVEIFFNNFLAFALFFCEYMLYSYIELR